MQPLLVGLLVGGRATRMGGAPKGLLASPDTGEPIAGRLARVCREALGDVDVVLLGNASAYAALALPDLPDDPPDSGPLGGLAALLAEASRRGRHALALAADLPYVTRDLVISIAGHAPGAPAVAPRAAGRWQPLFARYAPDRCLPIARSLLAEGRRAAHGILDELGGEAAVLLLDDEQTRLLDDWDTPEDVAGISGR